MVHGPARPGGSGTQRFKSVHAWLQHMKGKRRSVEIAGRQQLSRKRRSSKASVVVKLKGGRPRSAILCAASQKRCMRRWRASARNLLPVLGAEFIRLRVIGKSSFIMASDVRRVLRFAREFRVLRKDQLSLVVAMLYERAWRDPVISRQFLQHFRSALEGGRSPLDATWKAIVMARELAPAETPNHRFWPGPSAFCAARGPWAWKPHDVEAIARKMLDSGFVVDAVVFVQKWSSIPYMSDYFAFGYLRNLEASGMIRLRNSAKAASAMSEGVADLTALCPIALWGKVLQRGVGLTQGIFHDGDTALVVCETAKALHCLGFTLSSKDSTGADLLAEELGSGCGPMLVEFLQSCRPLTISEVCLEVGVRSTETALVNRYFPATRASWDTHPHVCRGSESIAPLLLKQLRSRGYLVSCSGPA